MMNKKVVDLRYARDRSDYKDILKRISDENKCPFCPKNRLKQKHPIKVIKKIGRWFITKNNYGYKDAKHRFMIIGDEHKEYLSELKPKDYLSIHKLVEWAVNKYKIKGAGLACRFGDPQYTGATVYHLHFHLISANLDKTGKSIPVYFPIG